MANEQTTVPLFVAAEVLTAADMNLSAGTGVPVFLNSTTRDAGFGGAGEKVLAEGQLCYLSSTNVVQYYDGAAWATVGPAAAPSSGLVFINATSFTAQTTVSMAAGTFTSTYKNYMVIIDITTGGSVNSEVSLRVNSAGTPRTASNYYAARAYVGFAGAQTLTGFSGTDKAGFSVGQGGSGGGTNIMVYDAANASQYTSFAGFGSVQGLTINGGQYFVTEANDGLTFVFATSSTGFYRVYGLADS